jgi:hypothetical protein
MSVSRRATLRIESANGQVEFVITAALTDSYTGTMMNQRRELICMSFNCLKDDAQDPVDLVQGRLRNHAVATAEAVFRDRF